MRCYRVKYRDENDTLCMAWRGTHGGAVTTASFLKVEGYETTIETVEVPTEPDALVKWLDDNMAGAAK